MGSLIVAGLHGVSCGDQRVSFDIGTLAACGAVGGGWVGIIAAAGFHLFSVSAIEVRNSGRVS